MKLMLAMYRHLCCTVNKKVKDMNAAEQPGHGGLLSYFNPIKNRMHGSTDL